MTDLAPCPFCGKPAEHDTYDPFDGYQGDCSVHRVQCTCCGAEVKAKTEEAAVSRWNSRTVKTNPAEFWECIRNHADDYTVFGYPLKGLLFLADAMKRLEIPTTDVEQYMRDTEKQYEFAFKIFAEEQRHALKNFGCVNMNFYGQKG